MNKLLKFCSIFVTTSFAFAEISQQKIEGAIDKIVPIIQNGIKRVNIPGCLLVVTRKDQVVFVKTFGETTIPTNNPKPINNNTLFPVSSVTKNITAILIGALVDEGKLNWNDPVRKYDKNFFLHSEELSKELTIKDLISHSSGFKHFSGDSLLYAGYPYNKIIDSFKHLHQNPGDFRKNYGYQNIIFGLVTSIIEKATGEKYEDLVKKYIFDKMGMKNSSAIQLNYETSRIGHIKYMTSRLNYDIKKYGLFNTIWNLVKSSFSFSPKQTVIGHFRYKNEIYPLQQCNIFHIFPATSGLSFSANDFAKYIEMLNNQGTYKNITIVKPETFQQITSNIVSISNIKDIDFTFPIRRFNRNGLAYGLGTFIAEYGDNKKNSRKIIFHMGGIYGATSFFAVSLDDNVGVGCVTNLGGTVHTLFAEYIVNQFLDLCFDFSEIDWVNEEIKRKEFFDKKQIEFFENKKLVLSPCAPLNKYKGTYTSPIYGDIKVTCDNNSLFLSNGIKSTVLEHVNGNIFKFPSKNMAINWFDSDEYIVFHKEKTEYNACSISCFLEGNTIFRRIDN